MAHPWPAATSAVSQVVGVLVLLAITVAMAAVVFVLAQQESGRVAEPPPLLALATDDAQGTATVQNNPRGIAWEDLEVSGCSVSILDAQGELLDASGPVRAGQTLSGCLPGDRLSVVHRTSGALVFQHAFP